MKISEGYLWFKDLSSKVEHIIRQYKTVSGKLKGEMDYGNLFIILFIPPLLYFYYSTNDRKYLLKLAGVLITLLSLNASLWTVETQKVR